ncbi:MAG: rod-binding protein [Hyphomicrobiales bacterium]|nr:rod-binding protein [Hyphomicrobiales bacterium]MBV8439516.1 rod-binding protein [Hyphomicrobiales bacterium]
MAFNPRSDVILEVLNAADPARASLAAERLSALAGSNAPAGDFAADLDKAASAPQVSLSAEGLADARSRLAQMADGPDKAARAKVEFEATLINSFVGELLPKDAGSVFGAGSTGDMWRSMLSEQISEQIAKSGALGLSRRLFATHDLVPARHGEAPTAAGDAAQMSANMLSAPSAATVDSGGVLFAARKRG